MLGWYISGGILALCAALLVFPVKIRVLFAYVSGKSDAKLTLYLFGIPLPLPAPKEKAEKAGRERRPKAKEEKRKETKGVTGFLAAAKALRAACGENCGRLRKLLDSLRKLVRIERFLLDVVFGTGDAARTGIAAGAVWGGAGLMTGVFRGFRGAGNLRLNVTPDFTKARLDARLDCIIVFRLAHSIPVGARTYLLVKRFMKISKINEKEV
jgi:hypothetical protein